MYSRREELGANFEILRENLVERGAIVHEHVNRNQFENLRSVEEIPPPYREIFSEFSHFNIIQSKVIDDVLHTDHSLVVSAPTGGGKTTIFELAIVRLLISLEHTQFSTPFKIVYICPMKALCEERLVDWHKKFRNFGLNAIAVTGDSEHVEVQNLLNHNLIITTPEKWDCVTRRWRDSETFKLVKIIKLVMIDEIHLLNEEFRGSTLETIVCRMKTIEESNLDDDLSKIRFVAVSATVPNIEDVAEWLGTNSKCHKFSGDYRPVKLNKIVLGYHNTQSKTSPFKFDLSLNYKLQSLIMQYSHGKPTLIFCGTRKIVEMTAKHILHHLTINLKEDQKQCLVEAANSISDVKVKETLVHGVGYHHAGMLPQTRRVVETLFRNGDLPILVTTSTLAMGVNLPAHLVIVKSTKCYANGGFTDYTETSLSQMIGRAGRPQFDTEATALILTTMKDKEKFEKMIGGLQPVESDLHKHLIEHLNAEVVLQTITDLEVAMRWLSSTFLYIRARKNPRYYGLTSSDPSSIDRRLLEMCQIELNKLIKAGMLTIDQDVLLKATSVGAAMAKYYLAFETMKLFTQITGGEILQQILALISKCHEFSEMYLRVNDKKCLNLLNKCRNKQTIRFPLNGKIKTVDMKINCIIQAVLGCLDICDHSILSETLKIMRNGERIVKCLIEYLESKDKCFQALLNAVILSKCFIVKLWENSPFVSKQLPGIGNVMSSQLVNAEKTTFQLILECDAREIELIINKKPPTGSKILNQIRYLPKYVLKLELCGKNVIKLTISLENALDLEQTCTVNRNSLMYLLVGDADNNILLYEKYSHSYLMENPTVFRFIDFQENSLRDIEAHFISEDWAGIDCTTKFENAPKEKGKGKKIVKKNQSDDTTYMQTFMEMYMKSKRNSDAKTPGEDFNNNEETYSSDKKKDVCNNSKIVIHGNVTIFDKNDSDDEETKRKRIVSTGKNAKCDGSVQCSLSALTASIPQDGFFASKAELDRSTVIGSQFFKQQCSSKRDDGVKRSPLKQVLLPSDVQLDRSIKKQFAFTPKKFSHCKSSLGESCANSTLSPSFENKPKTQKITWRSPLTYSPAVKFSPKLPYNRLTMSSTESDDHPSSLHSTPLNPEISKILNKTSSSTSETPSHSKTFFPLSDKAYEDSSLEEKADRTEEVLEKVGDFVSTQFLESYGLISPSTKTNTQIKSPNEYYHHLLTQTQSKEKMKEVKKEFDNNEKKRKRCANSESSDAGKRQETDKKRVDSREKTDATQSPYFSHSSKSEAKSTSSQDGPTKKVHIKKLIKPSKSQGHSSDRLMPSYSKYQKELNREEPAVVPERTSFGSYSASRGHSFGDEKDDPFNDSKQSALMQLALPPQSLQEDTRSRRNSSKTDSHNFDDYDDDEFFYDMDDDDLYDTLTYMDDRSRRSFATVNPIFKQYDDISADDDLSDGNGRSMPEYRNSRTSVGDDNLYRSRPHFVEYDTHRSNYFHPIDINAPSTSHYHPRYENHDHQYHKKPETITNPNYESDRSDRRRVSFRSDGYSNNSLTPYGRQSFRPPYYSFLPHEETSDFHQNKVSEEGYRYIRQMMEKENEPPPYQDRNANYHHAPQSISSALVEGSLNPNLPSSSSRDFVEESRFDFEGSRRERARTPFQERQEAARPEYHTPRSRPPLLVQPPSSPSFSNRNFVDDGHFERSSRGHLSTPFLEQLGLYRDHSTRDAETPRNTPRTRPRVLTERSINLNPGPSNRNFVDDDRFDFERRQLRTPFQEQVEPYPEYYGLEGDLPQRPQMPFYRGETSPPSRSSDRSYVMQKFFKHLK